MTAALRQCRCSEPRPYITPGKEHQCIVCNFQIPKSWGSHNIEKIFDRLKAGFPSGVPPAAQSIIERCLAREETGRRTFGFRFHGRNNFRDGLEEAADWLNYRAFEVLLALKSGNQELADRKLVVMMKILEAAEADIESVGGI